MNVKKLFVGHISIFLHPHPWKNNICYLYRWCSMFCSVHRPFVTPLLLFSQVRSGPHFVMSNYHQASPLATEIRAQHYDGLKSIRWDTLTRHLWCVEWYKRHICWKSIACLKRGWHSENAIKEDVCFSLTWYRSHLQSPWWMAQITPGILP